MFTEKQKKAASRIISQIARVHQVPEAEVRFEMEKAMEQGMSSSDPMVQARWASFSFTGEQPTVEEFILWAASMV